VFESLERRKRQPCVRNHSQDRNSVAAIERANTVLLLKCLEGEVVIRIEFILSAVTLNSKDKLGRFYAWRLWSRCRCAHPWIGMLGGSGSHRVGMWLRRRLCLPASHRLSCWIFCDWRRVQIKWHSDLQFLLACNMDL